VDRCALFVDAGYALADGAMAVHGTRRRDSVSWDHAGLLKLLAGLARDRTGLPVLRCYWYETAAEGRRTAEHDALAEMPGLKLRLVNALPGRREGIESQLRRDLVTLAKSGAISDAFIASANEHIAEIVAEVQDLGLRVVILHIASDGGWTIPLPLRQECDDIVEISGVHLRAFVDLIRGGESVATDEQYQGGAGTMVGAALTHHGLPAAALPAPGAIYQMPDNREYSHDGGYSGASQVPAVPAQANPVQATPVPVGTAQPGSYQADPPPGQSAQPQYFGAPPAAAEAGTQQSGSASALAGEPVQASPPAQPGHPRPGVGTGQPGHQQPVQQGADQAQVQAVYQNGAAASYQNGSTASYQNLPAGSYQNGAQSGQLQNGTQSNLGQGNLGQGIAGQGNVGQGNVGQGGPGLNGVGLTPVGPNQADQSHLGQGSPGPGGIGPGHPGGHQNGVAQSFGQNGPGQSGQGQGGPAPSSFAQGGQGQGGPAPSNFAQGGQGQGGPAPSSFAQGGQGQGGPAPSNFAQGGQGQGGPAPSNFAQGAQGQNGQGQGGPGQGGQGQNGAVPNNFGQSGIGQGGVSQSGVSQGGVSQSGSRPPGGAPAQGRSPVMSQNGYPADLPMSGPPAGSQNGSGQPGYPPPGQGAAAQAGAAQNGMAQNGMAQNGMAQNGAIQNGSGQYGYPGGNQGGYPPNPAQDQAAYQPSQQSGQGQSYQYAPGQPGPQHGGPRPGQQSGGFQAASMQPDARSRDPYGQGIPQPAPSGFDVAMAQAQGQSGFGQSDQGFAQGQPGPAGSDLVPQRNSFGQNQAQGVGALIQTQSQGPQAVAPQAVRVQQSVAIALPDAVKAAHAEGFNFGESVGRDAPGLWLEAVLARKPRMPSDLEARLLQGSVLPIDSLLHDEVRHSLRRGFWDALESARR
jgi:hypothetical protein